MNEVLEPLEFFLDCAVSSSGKADFLPTTTISKDAKLVTFINGFTARRHPSSCPVDEQVRNRSDVAAPRSERDIARRVKNPLRALCRGALLAGHLQIFARCVPVAIEERVSIA